MLPAVFCRPSGGSPGPQPGSLIAATQAIPLAFMLFTVSLAGHFDLHSNYYLLRKTTYDKAAVA